MTEDQIFAEWCIVELFGHRRLAGFVTEQEIFGASFLCLQIPASGTAPAMTQFYGPAAVFGVTPVTETMARAVAGRLRHEPVQRWELPPAITPDVDAEVREFAGDEAPF